MQDFKKVLAAQGLPANPIGTLDELKAANLPPKLFRSCSEPAEDGTNLGCPQWHNCTMSYKGLKSSEGGGPRMHCWERLKDAANGGGVVRNSQPCFWGVGQQEIAYDNKEVLRPIAGEGESYEALTYIADPKPSDLTNREQKLVKFTVPAFPRPGQEKKIATQVLRADIMRQEQERIRNEGAAQLLGAQGGVTPLDKRGVGRGKGAPEKG